MEEVRGSYFPGGFGVSDRAGGSDDGEVGFGGVGGALGQARRGDDGAGRRAKGEGRRAKVGAGRKAKAKRRRKKE